MPFCVCVLTSVKHPIRAFGKAQLKHPHSCFPHYNYPHLASEWHRLRHSFNDAVPRQQQITLLGLELRRRAAGGDGVQVVTSAHADRWWQPTRTGGESLPFSEWIPHARDSAHPLIFTSHGARRPKAVTLMRCESALYDHKAPTNEGERRRMSGNSRIHQESSNTNTHRGLLMKLGDRRGSRANKGGRHVWFVDATKSWTLGFVLKWKLAALYSVFSF